MLSQSRPIPEQNNQTAFISDNILIVCNVLTLIQVIKS